MPSQGVGYFERDGYYAEDDGAHKEASAWAGRGVAALGLSGPVDPERFRAVLEGEVPGGRRLGRKKLDGSITHRPGRDVTLTAPKSVSLMAMVGGDERRVAGIDRRWGVLRPEDAKGNLTPWRPERIAAAKGGVEVYQSEAMELRRGDRVRFTRNDPASGLTNGETATVEAVGRNGVRFRLENGSLATLCQNGRQPVPAETAFGHDFGGAHAGTPCTAKPPWRVSRGGVRCPRRGDEGRAS